MSIMHGTVWRNRCPEGVAYIRWVDDRFVLYIDENPSLTLTGPQLNDMASSLTIWSKMAMSKKKGRRRHEK